MIEPLRARLDDSTSRSLVAAVRSAIRDGVLREGDRLPPIRTIARELSLAPVTVSAAWRDLVRAGSIQTDGRRGTTVAPTAAGPRRYRSALQVGGTFTLDLSTGVPDPALLPDLRPALRSLGRTGEPGSYLDAPVLAELLDILRADWPYAADRITVMDGAMDALAQIADVHLRPGVTVAVEHPCFPPVLDLLEAAGIRFVPVGLDDDGPRAEEVAEQVRAGASVLFLQPRAQNPTGACLTAARAEQLAPVLRGRDVMIIEDDSAGSVSSSPALSLGQWLPHQTMHIRSFSKSHGPDLRLAALSGPAELLDHVTEHRYLGQGWTSRLLQRALIHLLTDAGTIREVASARVTYARRRTTMVEALRGHGIDVMGRDGLNVWLPVDDEAAAMVWLASRGIGVAAGAPFLVRPEDQAHVRVTTGAVTGDYERVAAELADAARLGPHAAPR